MKLTKKDYDWCFKKIKFWQKRLGMQNYNIDLLFSDLSKQENRASFWADRSGLCGNIKLCNKYNFKNKKEVELCIFHEMCECMLWQIGCMLEEKFNAEDVAKELHEVIRRLENLIFE